jgi:DNA primase
VIVVEGYMDVVGLAQLGVENVVASLGTATTGHNIHKLLKQAKRVVFCFDRDDAGDRAARRAMENSLEHLEDGKRVEILQMPGNQDPDEFIREHGKAAFDGLIAGGATRLSEYFVREVRKPAGASIDKQFNLATAEGRAQLVEEAKPLLRRISAPVLRVQITKAIANQAGLSQAEMEAQCGLKPLARNWRGGVPSRSRTIAVSQARVLLRAVLHQPARSARLPLELIGRETPEELALHAIAEAMDHGDLPAGAGSVGLLEFFRGSPHEAVLSMESAALLEEVDESVEETVFNDTLEKLRVKTITAEVDALSAKARAGALSPEEQGRYRDLLAAKAAAGSQRSD